MNSYDNHVVFQMNLISNLVFQRCFRFSTRQFLINCRTYKSNLSYEKLFPKAQSLNVVEGPIKLVRLFSFSQIKIVWCPSIVLAGQ